VPANTAAVRVRRAVGGAIAIRWVGVAGPIAAVPSVAAVAGAVATIATIAAIATIATIAAVAAVAGAVAEWNDRHVSEGEGEWKHRRGGYARVAAECVHHLRQQQIPAGRAGGARRQYVRGGPRDRQDIWTGMMLVREVVPGRGVGMYWRW